MEHFFIRATEKGFAFCLRSANGQSIATSECYATEAACRRGAESVRVNAAAPVEDLTAVPPRTLSNPKYQLYRDKQGQFRFRLRARNGRIIAVSQAYRSKVACLEGIDSVRVNAGEDSVP